MLVARKPKVTVLVAVRSHRLEVDGSLRRAVAIEVRASKDQAIQSLLGDHDWTCPNPE